MDIPIKNSRAVARLLAILLALGANHANADITVGQYSPAQSADGSIDVLAGDTLAYQIVATGPELSSGMQIIEDWPVGWDFVDAQATPVAAVSFDAASRQLTWFVEADATQSATLDVVAMANNAVQGQALNSEFTLGGSDAKLIIDSQLVTRGISGANVDLAISGTATNNQSGGGNDSRFMVSIVNNGPDTATSVIANVIINPIVENEIESGIFTNTTGQCDVNTRQCTFGDLAVGETATFDLLIQSETDVGPFTLGIDFEVTSLDVDSNLANNATFLSVFLPEDEDEGGGTLGPLGLLLLSMFVAIRRWRSAQPR